MFNEHIDDKRLGLWLRSMLGCNQDDCSTQKKMEMLYNYSQGWRFIYAVYHGKCLMQALTTFYSGESSTITTTCIVNNSTLCSVCENYEEICQVSCDIKDHLVLLLSTVRDLCDLGLDGATKTLLTAVLLGCNEKYVKTFDVLCAMLDDDDESCWGCGKSINSIVMSQLTWHKIIYVAVHVGYLDMRFFFRPFDSHYEVHRRYKLSADGEAFLNNPQTVMSVDPHSHIIDAIVGEAHRKCSTKSIQSRGVQLKPRIVAALEGKWLEGDTEILKFFGISVRDVDLCMHFNNCYDLHATMKNPHYLLDIIQFSRTQSTVGEISVCLDGETVTLIANRSYCTGVKICAGDGCTYTVTTKQRMNRCKDHTKMSLLPSGSCSCHIAYVYPRNYQEDGLLLLTPQVREKYTTTLLHQSGRYFRMYCRTLLKLLSVIYRQLLKRYKKVMEWTTHQWKSLLQWQI